MSFIELPPMLTGEEAEYRNQYSRDEITKKVITLKFGDHVVAEYELRPQGEWRRFFIEGEDSDPYTDVEAFIAFKLKRMFEFFENMRKSEEEAKKVQEERRSWR